MVARSKTQPKVDDKIFCCVCSKTIEQDDFFSLFPSVRVKDRHRYAVKHINCDHPHIPVPDGEKVKVLPPFVASRY